MYIYICTYANRRRGESELGGRTPAEPHYKSEAVVPVGLGIRVVVVRRWSASLALRLQQVVCVVQHFFQFYSNTHGSSTKHKHFVPKTIYHAVQIYICDCPCIYYAGGKSSFGGFLGGNRILAVSGESTTTN